MGKCFKRWTALWLCLTVLTGCVNQADERKMESLDLHDEVLFLEENINIQNIEKYQAFDNHVIAVEVEGIRMYYLAQRRSVEAYHDYLTSSESKTLAQVLESIFPNIYDQMVKIIPTYRNLWKMEARDFQGLVVLPDDSIRGILLNYAEGDGNVFSSSKIQTEIFSDMEKVDYRAAYSSAFPEMYQYIKVYRPGMFKVKFEQKE